MRVAVLPRDDAARVITSAIARGAWVVNVINLALALPIVIEYLTSRGLALYLPGPIVILVGLIALALVAVFDPRPFFAVAYLVAGAIGAVVFQVVLITASPQIYTDGYFLLNRPAVSLVLVAIVTTTWLTGIAWVLIGFLISTVVSVWVAYLTGLPFKTGYGPLLILTVYVATFLVLAGIQRSQRKRVPNFEELEQETQRLALEENMRSRVTAAVHDTLLNDLSLVMNAPDELDERMVARLREDIATLTSTEWLEESADAALTDDQDSALRNQIMLMVSDLQWRGLTVQITGSGSGIYRLTAETATAIVDSIRACLENVLRHSGTDVASVDLVYGDAEITVIVADQGRGFDVTGIPQDRLGVRFSIVERISSVGGTVKIWSSPGEGTSVVMRVPILAILSEHEGSTHGTA